MMHFSLHHGPASPPTSSSGSVTLIFFHFLKCVRPFPASRLLRTLYSLLESSSPSPHSLHCWQHLRGLGINVMTSEGLSPAPKSKYVPVLFFHWILDFVFSALKQFMFHLFPPCRLRDAEGQGPWRFYSPLYIITSLFTLNQVEGQVLLEGMNEMSQLFGLR